MTFPHRRLARRVIAAAGNPRFSRSGKLVYQIVGVRQLSGRGGQGSPAGGGMRASPTNSLIEHLRRAMLPDGAGVGDGELLDRFVERHDEVAFVALVNRHGPMVWGVCRRLLNQHDAE